jgi:hypothetical protein
MAGVLPIIDTAYDIAITSSIRLIRGWLALFDVPPAAAVTEQEEPVAGSVIRNEASYDALERAMPVLAARGKNTIMYAMARKTPLYDGPTIAFDSERATIPYGALVLVVEPEGRFYRVIWNTHEGWVLKEHLADRASLVYPNFIPGEENSVDHPNTARVRALLDDEFGLAHSEFPLQAGEYVLYKLWRRGLTIPWPKGDVPRTPGMWHTLLRGGEGIHMSVAPRAGSLMEYTEAQGIGHVAYVEAVFPDGMIAISEANHPHAGIYSERTLAKDVWQALRPVFIEVSCRHEHI